MRFVLRMAWREVRASWRRLLFFFLCVAIGVAGAIVCAAVHFRVGKAVKSRLLVVDGMVERLEKLSPSAKT